MSVKLITALRTFADKTKYVRVLQYSDGNERWPRRVLPSVNHVEYASRALLRLGKRWDKGADKRTDGQTDGGQIDALRLNRPHM